MPNAARAVNHKLELSKDLELPVNAVTQTFAFLARRGAGKSYGASKLAEEMLDAGGQVVAIDPVGTWYGLRLAADGKGRGFSIPVFGGLHGDIPLEPGAGALVADLVVERSISVVLDVSMFRKGDRKRFVTDFAEQLFHRKKSARSPLHVFIEEAQVFVPQRVMGDEARMLGAFEDIIKLGRNFGIGATLISQRPQAVNKDALNQTECLVVLQTNGSQERKALKEWVVDQGLDVDLLNELPSLPIGTAYVWSPQWLNVLKKVRIGKKRTFNASATPEVGDKVIEPRALAPVDLEAIRGAMAAVVEKARQEDPRALKRRIAELEAQLRKGTAPAAAKVEVKEVPVLGEKQMRELESAATRIEKAMGEAAKASEFAQAILMTLEVLRAPKRETTALSGPWARIVPAMPVRAKPAPPAKVEGELGAGERKMLEALALRHPTPLSRDQLGLLSRYAASGGTFRTYLPRLVKRGFVVEKSSGLELTPEGLAAFGGAATLAAQTPEEVRETWRHALAAGPRKMFDALVEAYPAAMSKHDLGVATNYEASGGTFRTYLPKLKKLGLVTGEGEEVRAADALFGE